MYGERFYVTYVTYVTYDDQNVLFSLLTYPTGDTSSDTRGDTSRDTRLTGGGSESIGIPKGIPFSPESIRFTFRASVGDPFLSFVDDRWVDDDRKGPKGEEREEIGETDGGIPFTIAICRYGSKV